MDNVKNIDFISSRNNRKLFVIFMISAQYYVTAIVCPGLGDTYQVFAQTSALFFFNINWLTYCTTSYVVNAKCYVEH